MRVSRMFSGRLRRAVLLAGLGAVGWAMPAAGQLGTWQPSLAGELAGTDWFKLVSAGGVVSTFSNPAVYIGPYTATLTSDPTHATFSIYCADFLHGIAVGQVWEANVSTLSPSGLAGTRLGQEGIGDAMTRYQKAVWLATQFVTNQTRAQWTGIHDAIWASITPAYGAVRTAEGQSWLNQVNSVFALGTPTDVDWSQWRVVTDVGGVGAVGGTQEFIVAVPPSTVTPEPETYLMMLTGLVALVALTYRRRQQMGA